MRIYGIVGEGNLKDCKLDYNGIKRQGFCLKTIILESKDKQILEVYKLQQKLENKNVIKIEHLEEKSLENDKKELLIVMVKYDQNLQQYRQHLQEKKVNPFYIQYLAIDFLKQILDSYDFFYQNQIVHRNIKPTNILVNNKNTHKAVYFLAKLNSSQFYEKGKTYGQENTTHEYAPPEINNSWSFTPNNFDELVAYDIYSMGQTFYYFLYNRLPYDNKKQQIDFYESKQNLELQRVNLYGNFFYSMTESQLDKRIKFLQLKENVNKLLSKKKYQFQTQIFEFQSEQQLEQLKALFESNEWQKIPSLPTIFFCEIICDQNKNKNLTVVYRKNRKTLQQKIDELAFLSIIAQRLSQALDFLYQVLSAYSLFYNNKIALRKIEILVSEKKQQQTKYILNFSSIEFFKEQNNFQTFDEFVVPDIQSIGSLFYSFFTKFSFEMIFKTQPKSQFLQKMYQKDPKEVIKFPELLSKTKDLLHDLLIVKYQPLQFDNQQVKFLQQQPLTSRYQMTRNNGDFPSSRSTSPFFRDYSNQRKK